MSLTPKTKKPFKRCCICHHPIDVPSHGWTDGHNAEPVKSGRCCSVCNDIYVIPARMQQLQRLRGETG